MYDTSTRQVIARLAATPGGGEALPDTVGNQALVTYHDWLSGVPTKQLIWDPASGGTVALPGTAYSVAQRRTPGWLWRKVSAACYARVTLAAPTTAIAVRGGRLVAVDVATGQELSTGTMGAIVATGNTREVSGAQWETSDTYIARAAWDGQWALVRCRVSDGHCDRLVRSLNGITIGW